MRSLIDVIWRIRNYWMTLLGVGYCS